MIMIMLIRKTKIANIKKIQCVIHSSKHFAWDTLFNPQKNLKLVLIILNYILEMRNLNQCLDNNLPNVTWLGVKRVMLLIRQSDSIN